MGNKMNLTDVIELARFAHRNQYDKAGMPYIEHPLRVLANVQAQGCQPYVQMAAVLHDVTEDTSFTADMLLALGVPEAAVDIVDLLDRDRSESIFYLDYFIPGNTRARINHRPIPYGFEAGSEEYKNAKDAFYYKQIRDNPGALMVKLADIGDNTQPWRLAYLPEETQKRLRAKYDSAILQLTGGNLA